MTKIKTYTLKDPVVGTDKWIGSNGVTGETKNFSAEGVADYVMAGLEPEVGGTLAINEITYTGVLTTPEDVVNALDPNQEVQRYEVLVVSVNDEKYIFKLQNVTVGVTQTAVTASDFITIPTSVGPTGATGVAGANADMTRTSATSLTIASTGSKTATYTASTNLGWSVGTRLRFANDASNYMEGTVTAVSTTSVTITADNSLGSGTFTSWNIGISGDVGADATANNLQKIKTASWTLEESDNNNTIFINNGAVAVNITVPTALSDNFAVGFIQQGSGLVTFVASGTTIENPVGLKIKGEGFSTYLEKVGATTVYYLTGDTKV